MCGGHGPAGEGDRYLAVTPVEAENHQIGSKTNEKE